MRPLKGSADLFTMQEKRHVCDPGSVGMRMSFLPPSLAHPIITVLRLDKCKVTDSAK